MNSIPITEALAQHLAPPRPGNAALAALAGILEVSGQMLLIAVTVTFAVLFPFLFTRRASSS